MDFYKHLITDHVLFGKSLKIGIHSEFGIYLIFTIYSILWIKFKSLSARWIARWQKLL